MPIVVMDWISQNLETVRLISYVLSGVATGASGLAGVLGLRRRIRKWRKTKRKRLRESTQQIADWYKRVYRALVVGNTYGPCEKLTRSEFLKLTVQEACALCDCEVPDWAHSGLERAPMSRFS